MSIKRKRTRSRSRYELCLFGFSSRVDRIKVCQSFRAKSFTSKGFKRRMQAAIELNHMRLVAYFDRPQMTQADLDAQSFDFCD